LSARRSTLSTVLLELESSALLLNAALVVFLALLLYSLGKCLLPPLLKTR